MTLDEAIKHVEKVAKQNEEDAVIYSNCKNHKKNLYEIGLAENAEKKCCKRAEEHRRLAEWLKELKRLREQTRWIPCSERMPEEKINQNTQDFEYVLCSTTFGDVRPYKFGKQIGWEEAHFWHGPGIVDEYVVAWMEMPKPYAGGEK